MKTAIVTGVQGQDGSYLAELLLNKGYKVIGVKRRKSVKVENENFRIKHFIKNKNFSLVTGDITDAGFINNLVLQNKPREIYNLAAMSFVQESFNTPSTTIEINTKGVINILEAIKAHSKKTKFYQASSSELYGDNPSSSYDEKSKFCPISQYAVSKESSHHLVRIYREGYGLFAVAGILFNHESERRGDEFVTKKIAKGAARISLGLQKYIELGNLQTSRDWGHAEDYVEAMWLMLQQKTPEDFVIATGELHTLEEFLSEAFLVAGIKNWKKYVKINKKFKRPRDVIFLKGNISKAKKILKWKPKIKFKKLVERMVKHELIEGREEKWMK